MGEKVKGRTTSGRNFKIELSISGQEFFPNFIMNCSYFPNEMQTGNHYREWKLVEITSFSCQKQFMVIL